MVTIRWFEEAATVPEWPIVYTRPREMTAADLGLRLLQGWMLMGVSGWKWDVDSDAPYSFWLGADHG